MKSFDEIFKEVQNYTGFTREELTGKRRYRTLAGARKYFAQLARKETYSYPQIARALKKDHTSIMHSLKSELEIPRKEDLRIMRVPRGLITKDGYIDYRKIQKEKLI